MVYSRTIGFIAPLVHGYYFGKLLTGVLDTATARGGKIVAVQSIDAELRLDTLEERSFTTRLAWDNLDALVVALACVPDDYLAAFAATGKPVVTIGREIGEFACPTVGPDNHRGVRALVDHLVDHGHQRIACVGREPSDGDDRARYRAYVERMTEHGLRPYPHALVSWRLEHSGSPDQVIRDLLAGEAPPTAILATTDMTAFSVIAGLAANGLSVPADMAVVGFDDVEDASAYSPPLSTVAQSFTQAGALACGLALDALDGHPARPGHHLTPVNLVVRSSCGCQPRDQQAASAKGTEDRPADRLGEYHRFENLRRYYKVSTDLVRRHGRHLHSLDWLAGTEVEFGCLAWWESGRKESDDTSLRITDCHPQNRESHLADPPLPPAAFPPAAFIALVNPAVHQLLVVLPVRFDGSDWGFLALIGAFDVREETAFEMFNHWAALLTVALDQEQAIRSGREMLKGVQASEERYALAAEATSDGLWDWDLDSGGVYYSTRWKALLGYGDNQIAPHPDEWLERVHPEDRQAVDHVLRRQVEGHLPRMELEYRIRAADGGYRWMLTHGQAVRDASGRITRLVGSMSDVTAKKMLEDQLRHDALYDALTGLPNRALFLDRLNQTLATTRRRRGSPFAVVFLDLNGFKIINESLGHRVGDEVLVQVAQRLAARVRTHDVVSRFGGDEFLLLLHDVSEDTLRGVVDRILATLATPLAIGDRSLVVSAAAGIAISRTGRRDAEELVRDADTAMYQAKAFGGSTSVMFAMAMHVGVVDRFQLESDLRQAVADEQFELYYQPIVRLAGPPVPDLPLAGQPLEGVEALIRWNRPGHGLTSPDDFLPVAESIGLIRQIGRWTIRETCRQIREWREGYPGCGDVKVSVNLSNRQFWDPELRPTIWQALSEFAIPPSSLVFEVTEGVIMHNKESATDVLRQLHADGFQLHVDDFGTGYSSLATLHRYPIDALKIDRSFVTRMVTDTRGYELVQVMITMGLNLGIDVVAEGVETTREAEMLIAVGCPLAQGYLFSRPVAVAGTRAFLELPR